MPEKMLKNKGFKLEKGELSYDEKFRLARSFTTPPEALERLANDKFWLVRLYVAQNPNTSPETLARLANYGSSSVRYCVSINSNTPQYIKDYLKIKKFLNYYE